MGSSWSIALVRPVRLPAAPLEPERAEAETNEERVDGAERRFVFGMPIPSEGLSFIAVAVALFGLTEVIRNHESKYEAPPLKPDLNWRRMLPNRSVARKSVGASLRGSAVGGLLRALPGAGLTTSSFISDMVEVRVSRAPAKFGSGAIEGVVAPEAANNAAAQTGYVPTLALGIPGMP